MENDDLCCTICQEQYGDDRLPRILVSCGHASCTSCIDQMITNCSNECPECRQTFKVARAADLPVNYPLLKVARSASVPAVQANAGECRQHKALKFYYCAICNVFCCRDCVMLIHKQKPKGNCDVVTYEQVLKNVKTAEVMKVDTSYASMKTYMENSVEQVNKLSIRVASSEASIDEYLYKVDLEKTKIQIMKEKRRTLMEAHGKVKNMTKPLVKTKTPIQEAQTLQELSTYSQKSTAIVREFENVQTQTVKQDITALTVEYV